MTQPNLNNGAGHYAKRELGAGLNAERTKETPRRAAKALLGTTDGSQMRTRRTDLATKIGRAPKVIDFDAIQLSRALARWENEGGAGTYTLKKYNL